MTSAAAPKTTTMTIGKIKPYWRNPRTIPPDAVAVVKESIRTYGYQQPIVVDRKGIIVVGHTRFAAVKELGWKQVPVIVSDLPEEQLRRYRLVDNRTQEMSSWDHSALVTELREFDDGVRLAYFPDLDLEVGQLNDALVTQDEVDGAIDTVTGVKEKKTEPMTVIVCPSCTNEFPVKAASLPGLNKDDLDELIEQAG